MDEQHSFINVALPRKKKKRQVFVAYSYRLYPKDDYRKIYLALEKAFDTKFIFADEKISNLHILQKICNYIVAPEKVSGVSKQAGLRVEKLRR